MACGEIIFQKKIQILEFVFYFYFFTFIFLMLLLLHKTLKGSRNIQGVALIRAVLFIVCFWILQTVPDSANTVADSATSPIFGEFLIGAVF